MEPKDQKMKLIVDVDISPAMEKARGLSAVIATLESRLGTIEEQIDRVVAKVAKVETRKRTRT